MVYKKGPLYKVRPVSQILEDIDEAGDLYGAKISALFLPAGNTIAMPTSDLAAVCRHATAKLPALQRITVYGSSQYIAAKGLADMALLREAGLSRIHVGLESGDDEILARVKKGTNAEEQIKAGNMVVEAGMELSEYVILGLGGMARSDSHALKTAAALNAIAPHFVRLRTLVPKINTLLLHQVNKGRFKLLTPQQVLKETRLLIKNLCCNTVLTSDHYTNYLNLTGKLPADKDRLLEEIDQALNWDPSCFRPDFIGNQ
jgi:radical SAM superfamily enzyme YgiQ (UPF0313 family)